MVQLVGPEGGGISQGEATIFISVVIVLLMWGVFGRTIKFYWRVARMGRWYQRTLQEERKQSALKDVLPTIGFYFVHFCVIAAMVLLGSGLVPWPVRKEDDD